MKALVFKELKSVFCSSFGAFFSLAFLLIVGGLLWFFSGKYSVVDSGYTTNLKRTNNLSLLIFMNIYLLMQ